VLKIEPQRRQNNPNHVVNHIAIAVPDVEAAVKWYTEILGFRKLRQTPRYSDRNITPDASIFKIYGEKLQKLKIAFLTSGNGVGIELFEFVDPPMEHPATFDYTRGGVFHICLTVADPEALCAKAIAAGGKKIGETVMPWAFLDEDDIAMYIQDPWGTVIEFLSCSFEMLAANRVES
jgi:catechol 2,3-dioxygenase-like lactoylglutathione lyase family enzyme